MYFVLRCCVLAGQLAVGTCEIVMLNRDSSIPRRTIARQTARCACRRGQIAGTTRARPACVDGKIHKKVNKNTNISIELKRGQKPDDHHETVNFYQFPRIHSSFPCPSHPVIYCNLKGKVLAEGQK